MSHSDNIEKFWAHKLPKPLKWSEFEYALSEALHDVHLTNNEVVALCKELLDSFTHRGHFRPEEYYFNRSSK